MCGEPNNSEAIACQSCGSPLLLQQRYRITRQLGAGISQTWLAIDLTKPPTARCVVHQLRHPAPPLQSFKTIARHPQLPTVLDTFEQDGCCYVVQDFIAGRSLAMQLRDTDRLSSIEVWHLLESLLPVLHYIHSQGLIHGDIKPENILQPNGDALENAAWMLVDIVRSPAQFQMGSPEYAAPEQLMGNPVSASDLYSLGTVCIQLLTGMRPFDLCDSRNLRWAWRDYWLPHPNEVAHVDRLADLLDRLIAPSLNDRFGSAAEVIDEIQRCRGKKISVAMPTTAPVWQCTATLTGHIGLFASVNSVAIAPNGTQIASASDDKTIRIWDAHTGAALMTLSGHTQFVNTVAFHPDNANQLASGSRDRTIKLWNLQTQEITATLTQHQHHINTVAFNPVGEWLASGSSDKTIKLWNLSKHDCMCTLTGHQLAINAIACHPTQPLLASASTDTTIRIWNLLTCTSICTLVGHTAALRAIAFSPDGQLLASAGEDKTIRLWDTQSWSCTRILSGHSWPISALAFSPDSQILFSGSWDKTIKLWQVATGQEYCLITGHTDSITEIAIGPGGKTIASSSKDKTIKLYQCEDGFYHTLTNSAART